MLARELSPGNVGQTIVVGLSSKKRRGVIRQVFNADSYTRVVYEGNMKRSIVLALDDEVELEI